MDIEKNYSCLERNCKVFQKGFDIDVDYQESIPAYCDDIFKVVKCVSQSYITSIQTNFNEVKIVGKSEICLTYYNESSCLCYADFEEEFTKNIDIENLSDNAFVYATVCDKYTSFRVINQRRIDIHSASCIHVSVYDNAKCPCISSCDNSKLKTENLRISNIIGSSITKIEFDEEFSVPSDSKPIKRIISGSAFASLTETKIIKDKALVKAVVTLDVLYTTDETDEQISKCEYSFGISKIIDVSGVSENDFLLADLKIGNLFYRTKASSNDTLGVIETFGEISVAALFIKEMNQSVITDGYVLNRKTNCSYSDFTCMCNGKMISEAKSVNLELEIPNEVAEIKEISLMLIDSKMQKGKLLTKANYCIVALNTEGVLMSYSNTKEFEIDLNTDLSALSALSVSSYDFSIKSSAAVDMRININVNAYLYKEETVKVLSEIDVDDHVIESPEMTLYFGKENESVWSIAKSFSSDIDLITKENELKSDVLECNKVLIIPSV